MTTKKDDSKIIEFPIKLDKPIIFFDLETTGVDVVLDRIVQIYCLKRTSYVNPEMKIPQDAIDIHGITNDKVANKPTFKNLAKSMFKWFEGSDLGGFNNNHFDNMLLGEEFAREEIMFPSTDTKSVDAGVIFKKMEKRTLSASMKFYCGVDNFEEEAHDANADTNATLQVFIGQLEMYEDLKKMTIGEISTFCKLREGQLDFQGKLYRDENGVMRYNFGTKAKGKTIAEDLGFAEWILEKDFPRQTKLLVRLGIKEAQESNPELFS